MSISYTVAGIGTGDTTVEVTYTNADSHEHKRTLNIPYLENGEIDTEYWQEILDGQLRGVQNKSTLGVISFVDPNAESEEPSE
jgi:hypothetical protein|tara:strand:- start:175 stop:423 length:249 start_codon:yes stop_codon:yes gene_type:complete